MASRKREGDDGASSKQARSRRQPREDIESTARDGSDTTNRTAVLPSRVIENPSTLSRRELGFIDLSPSGILNAATSSASDFRGERGLRNSLIVDPFQGGAGQPLPNVITNPALANIFQRQPGHLSDFIHIRSAFSPLPTAVGNNSVNPELVLNLQLLLSRKSAVDRQERDIRSADLVNFLFGGLLIPPSTQSSEQTTMLPHSLLQQQFGIFSQPDSLSGVATGVQNHGALLQLLLQTSGGTGLSTALPASQGNVLGRDLVAAGSTSVDGGPLESVRHVEDAHGAATQDDEAENTTTTIEYEDMSPMVQRFRPRKVSLGEDGFPIDLPIPLAVPEDEDLLAPLQVFLRQQMEAFRASEHDTASRKRGRNKSVVPNQVGVRCRWCAHLPVKERQRGSAYFPARVSGIYQSAQNMLSMHLQCGRCPEMPEAIRKQFSYLLSVKGASIGAGRPYWGKVAENIGLVDTDDGIRFFRDIEAFRARREGLVPLQSALKVKGSTEGRANASGLAAENSANRKQPPMFGGTAVRSADLKTLPPASSETK